MKNAARILLVTLLCVFLIACGVTGIAEESLEGKTLGWSMYSLKPVILSAVTDKVRVLCEEAGITLSVADADLVAATQISQVENFISAGVDAIMVMPLEPAMMEATVAQAADAGIGVFVWDTSIDRSAVNYLIDNTVMGKSVGEYAGKWVKEVYGDEPVEMAVIQGGPQIVHAERSEGIVAGLEEFVPNGKIVAQVAGVSVEESMTVTENFMQANPNIKVICVVGDSMALGANETLTAMGLDPAEVGIFSVDATNEACEVIQQDGFIKMSVGIGTPQFIAEEVFGYCVDMLNGIYTPDNPHDVFRDTEWIDKTNVDAWLAAE